MLEQFGKFHRTLARNELAQQLNFFTDRPFVVKNIARLVPLLKAFEHTADGMDEVEQGNLRARRRFCWFKFELAREAGKNIFLLRLALLQLRGGVFELFVFDELADQLPARVFLLLVALGLDLLVHRQQFAALDIHERRGHHEKLAGDFEVELAHQLDVLDELRGDLRQVDLVNVHLLLFHQVKEQVERAFEHLELDFVFCHGLRWRTRLNGERILTRKIALAMPERSLMGRNPA